MSVTTAVISRDCISQETNYFSLVAYRLQSRDLYIWTELHEFFAIEKEFVTKWFRGNQLAKLGSRQNTQVFIFPSSARTWDKNFFIYTLDVKPNLLQHSFYIILYVTLKVLSDFQKLSCSSFLFQKPSTMCQSNAL